MFEVSTGELRVRLGEVLEAARSLTGQAALIGPLFDTIQRGESSEPYDVRPTYMSLVAGAQTDVDRIGLCLEHAEANHWLPAFARTLTSLSSLPSTIFLELLLGPQASAPSASLPDRIADWSATRVCRITGGVEPGTGFLVGPDLVLTCHHVVAGALTPGGRLCRGASIECRFAYVGQEPVPFPATSPELTARVLAVAGSSPAAAIEFAQGGRTRLSDLAGFDDFALLRLASRPGDIRGWFRLARPPAVSESVHVWHRTGSAPVAYGSGQIIQHRSPTTLRRLYMDLTIGQTGGGASGSPYANARGEAVALHQAGGAAGAGRRNRAVPSSPAAPSVAAALTAPARIWWVEADVALPEPALGSSGSTAPYYFPLVGRFALQAAIHAARAPDAVARLIRADGPPRSGKTRTRFVIRTLCHEQHHLVATFDLSGLSRDARPLMEAAYHAAMKGLRSVSGPPPVIQAAALSDYAAAERFTAAWLAQIDRLRGDRMVWLCIDGFGQHPLPTEGDRLCLEALVAALASHSWLRLCLMGASPSFTGQPHFAETIAPPGDDEIGYYLTRRIAAAGFETPSPAQAALFVDAVRSAAGKGDVPPVHVAAAVDRILREHNPGLQTARLVDPWGPR